VKEDLQRIVELKKLLNEKKSQLNPGGQIPISHPSLKLSLQEIRKQLRQTIFDEK
jgi:hypothetical protein